VAAGRANPRLFLSERLHYNPVMSVHVFKAGSAPGRNEACPCGSGRKYKQCCALKPTGPSDFARDFATGELNRGLALERKGRVQEAIVAYEVAAAELPEARSRLARALEGLGLVDEAIGHFRAAAGPAPTGADRRMDLVLALVLEEDMAQAEAQLRQVLLSHPDLEEAHSLLGRILAEAGDFDGAAACFEKALALKPGHAGVYYQLVRARKLTEADRPLLRRMIAAVPSVTLASHSIKLNLAIAKAFDDLADYGQSMRFIGKASAIKKSLAPFDRKAFAANIDALISQFSPAFLARHAQGGNASEKPVLIVGMPRSGTTLCEQILSSHSQVVGAGELRFWSHQELLFDQRPDDSAIDAFRRSASHDYLEVLGGLAPDAARVIDKNPFNFLFLGLFHIAFPRARIIHCRRHPIDTSLSIVSTHIRTHGAFPADLDDMVFYYREYRRLMTHWRASLPTDRFIEVDYETVVADPETETRARVAALGLDWEDACLRPEQNQRLVKTSSLWQVRQPIYRSSSERWRRYEPWLGPLRELLALA
jgi:tetratricopeptide (TPR) repeat protein